MSQECTFLRIINEGKKGESIRNIVVSMKNGQNHSSVFIVEPERFKKIPTTPFVYWISEQLRDIFTLLPKFEDGKRTGKQGIATADDFRFARTWWEILSSNIMTGKIGTGREDFIKQSFNGKKWAHFAKGGEYSPFYADISLVINWERNGEEINAFPNSVIRNPDYYFQTGITWSSRPHKRGGFSHVPPGIIFSVSGMMIFSQKDDHWNLLSVLNSNAYIGLVHLLMPRGGGESGQTLKYEIGYLTSVPIPSVPDQYKIVLEKNSKSYWHEKGVIDSHNELSHIFVYSEIFPKQDTLRDSISKWERKISDISENLTKKEYELDIIWYLQYQILKNDQESINSSLGNRPFSLGEREKDPLKIVSSFISYIIGCVFGRWDIRYATGEKQLPDLPDPLTPLPACSPGMLQGDDGLPVTESLAGYPLNVQWNGILVEDPGYSQDIVQRIREVLQIIYDKQAEAIEAEACSILCFENINDYFKRPSAGGFWDDHIKRYTKSKRKSPIYWKLSSNKGNYSIWLYYHRITRDTLFIVLNEYINPKIELEGAKYQELKQQKEREKDTLSRSQLTKLGKEIEVKSDFINELKDFKEKLEKIAKRGYNPDFDDGVILNMAPLHEVIPWKEPKACWEDLEKGKYDWAHIAMKYWPDRVKEKCKKDKSIAIAHGLEHLYEAD